MKRFHSLVLALFVMAALVGIVYSAVKPVEPLTSSPIVTLNETDSKIIIEASQAAVTANTKLQSTFETLCRQNGKDPQKYTVAPTPGLAGRVDLKPIEAPAAAQGK